jgi:hypothetical protein
MRVKEMLDTYPRDFNVDSGLLAHIIETLEECANTCTQCADACLSEGGLSPELAKCIRLDLDCADVCGTLARVLSRQTEYDANVSRNLLMACAAVCRSCADECSRHAEHMAHCRVCAESCRTCDEACTDFLAAITS